MHIYDVSTSRTKRLQVKVNWSRELTFSSRQINFILETVPEERGVYCIYAKNYRWKYRQYKWSGLIYIGSGWLDDRLSRHLARQENEVLADYLDKYDLAYRFDRIEDDDEDEDWPRNVEAELLDLFKIKFGNLPLANRREEPLADLDWEVEIEEPDYFSILEI